MGREGPCFHCGIKHTPLWRVGPPEKPVLCNACGSRWRIRGTLAAYTPKHAYTQSSKLKHLPLNDKPTIPYIKSNLRGKVAKSQNCSTCCEDHSNNKCTSGSTVSSSRNCTHMENVIDSVHDFEWNFKIPKKKRSPPRQFILTRAQRFHKQLLQILHEQECARQPSINEEYPLVYHNNNWMMPPNETRAGAAHIRTRKPSSCEKENQAPLS